MNKKQVLRLIAGDTKEKRKGRLLIKEYKPSSLYISCNGGLCRIEGHYIFKCKDLSQGKISVMNVLDEKKKIIEIDSKEVKSEKELIDILNSRLGINILGFDTLNISSEREKDFYKFVKDEIDLTEQEKLFVRWYEIKNKIKR